MKIRFIQNPKSGRTRKENIPALVNAFIAEHKLDARLVQTEYPLHATRLAQASLADGCDHIVAIGGDGTVNEIAAALVNTPATLGVIPRGSGDGLARALGIPRQAAAALDVLLRGKPRVIDTATVNGIPFFNIMGAGFDATISHAFANVKGRGFAGYARLVAKNFLTYKSPSCEIAINDKSPFAEKEFFILSLANTDQYGNNAIIAPGARPDDGQLNLTLIRRQRWWNFFPRVLRLMTGTLKPNADICFLSGQIFQIALPAPEEIPIHIDGEPRMTSRRLEIKTIPKSLRIQVP